VTIRRKLRLSLTLAAVVTLALLAALAWTQNRIEQLGRSAVLANEVVLTVFELDRLTYELVFGGAERAREQWRIEHGSLERLLGEMIGSGTDSPAVERISAAQLKLEDLFSSIAVEPAAEAPESGEPSPPSPQPAPPPPLDAAAGRLETGELARGAALARERQEILFHQLVLFSRVMVNEAAALHRESLARQAALRRWQTGVLLGALLVLGGVLIGGFGLILQTEGRVEARTVELLAEIERRRGLEQELQQRNGDLAAASHAKDEFLAVVSHELRTPLTALLGWVRLLRTGSPDAAKLQRGLDVIERNARAQASLIDDLLDVSRIVSGKMALDLRTLDLLPVVEAALDAVRPAAAARQVDLQCAVGPGDKAVRGDPNRLQQVVYNLLSNAIKFTPEGGHVELRLERAGRHVAITVSDTGIGMAQELLPHVFERFRQAGDASTRKHQGLGLGLAIVRHLVELHGGEVAADSPGEGQGAVFTVRLPVTALQPPGEAGDAPAGRTARRLAGVRVLVVEDDADSRELLLLVLAQQGASTAAAGSVPEALERLRELRPDLLLSDIGLPGEDGYSLIRRVRAWPAAEGGDVPAVALTAFAKQEDRQRALEAGFQEHVAKPVDPELLVSVLAGLLARRAV
jgi:signal transduction histidine kinase/CheY-like chemotaxis protein